MKIVINNNYLRDINVFSSYYELKEFQNYYRSIKLVGNRRELYEKYIEFGKKFVEPNNIENYMNILDKYVFSIEKNKIDIRKEKNIPDIYPKGFKLLNWNPPFNYDSLKKAYHIAAKKYHPDMGGDEKLMKILNEAYDIYHNYLQSLQLLTDLTHQQKIC